MKTFFNINIWLHKLSIPLIYKKKTNIIDNKSKSKNTISVILIEFLNLDHNFLIEFLQGSLLVISKIYITIILKNTEDFESIPWFIIMFNNPLYE